jgi:hypothetical protein
MTGDDNPERLIRDLCGDLAPAVWVLRGVEATFRPAEEHTEDALLCLGEQRIR